MLRINNLSKTYSIGENELEVLKGVSLRIEEGEFTAIMGPSGSGKSTLMHIIGCLDRPTGGTYLLTGEEVSKIDEDRLAEIRNKKIGFVFQQFNLLPRTSLINNVEVPLIYAGVDKTRRYQLAKETLKKVGLGHRLDHQPNEISGGQKQRVAIARALINDPALILADEPTGNLDIKTSEEIMQLFHELNDLGHTIVLVTHEEDIAGHAKRVIHLRDGRIINDEVIA